MRPTGHSTKQPRSPICWRSDWSRAWSIGRRAEPARWRLVARSVCCKRHRDDCRSTTRPFKPQVCSQFFRGVFFLFYQGDLGVFDEFLAVFTEFYMFGWPVCINLNGKTFWFCQPIAKLLLYCFRGRKFEWNLQTKFVWFSIQNSSKTFGIEASFWAFQWFVCGYPCFCSLTVLTKFVCSVDREK